AIIMLSNLFLVQVNSSDHDFAFQSIARLAKDKVMWAVNIFTVFGLLIILYTPVNHFLKFEPLSASQLFGTVGIAAVAVMWYELVKLVKKIIK
ncbi:MAG: cation transporting ATPase C-terminal domain-containing protein, partial [Lachnospiraceae bacterium]|nr:cation transporting ATPase C-terminal domain-containing protein [Lachnospiraceae bacterium]